MKNLFKACFLLIILCTGFSADAQGSHGHGKKANKEEWMRKMKEFKHGFLVSELELSEQQAEDFFIVYDAKEDERFAVERLLRKMERNISNKIKDGNVTDEEINECIDEQFRFNAKMAEIDKKYEKKFRKCLNNKQLFKLPRAERRFMNVLMENRHLPHPPKTHTNHK